MGLRRLNRTAGVDGEGSDHTRNAVWPFRCWLGSLIKLLGDEFRSQLHKLVYLWARLPSPTMALSLEGS